MPAIQTTYTGNYAPAYVGMVANQETRNVISRNVVDASLAFGVPVFQGVGQDDVTATPGTLFRGISCADKSVRSFAITNGQVTAPAAPDAYAQHDTAAILTLGVVWVLASHAVTAGEPVFITSTGLFTDVASGDTALANATFDSTASAGGLVKIRLS